MMASENAQRAEEMIRGFEDRMNDPEASGQDLLQLQEEIREAKALNGARIVEINYQIENPTDTSHSWRQRAKAAKRALGRMDQQFAFLLTTVRRLSRSSPQPAILVESPTEVDRELVNEIRSTMRDVEVALQETGAVAGQDYQYTDLLSAAIRLLEPYRPTMEIQ